jgi:Uma2 family endonuclease
MSARLLPPPQTSTPPDAPPPLESGDRLTRDEFERRYQGMPHLKKAELLKGIVYMPSPVRNERHGEPHAELLGWLAWYKATTPGVRVADNATVRLGLESEPQPDALLRIAAERGGQSSVDPDDYLSGAPELAAEIASSSVSYDLHVKLEVYREHGVREYLVWRVLDQAIDWLVLRGDRYEALEPGSDGILRSQVFPGLWLDPEALVAGEGQRVLAVLQEGLASSEHATFVEQLRHATGTT